MNKLYLTPWIPSIIDPYYGVSMCYFRYQIGTAELYARLYRSHTGLWFGTILLPDKSKYVSEFYLRGRGEDAPLNQILHKGLSKAQRSIDELCIKQGYVPLTKEQYEKLQLLI